MIVRRALRVVVPIAVVGLGAASIWAGLASDGGDAPGDGIRVGVRQLDVQRSYEGRAVLAPREGTRLRGTVTAIPDPDDAGRTVVDVLLDNRDPDLARFHADIRTTPCARVASGGGVAARFHLEPIDDGATSRTLLPVPTSSLTTGGYSVVLQDTEEERVHACGALVPEDAALAAATRKVTSDERSCATYLRDLPDAKVRALDPATLPQGQCRVQAEALVAATSRRALRVRDFQADLAARTLLGLRDCLVDAGLAVPPLERTTDGRVVLLVGLARRDPSWPAASARCDRAHPVPDPLR